MTKQGGLRERYWAPIWTYPVWSLVALIEALCAVLTLGFWAPAFGLKFLLWRVRKYGGKKGSALLET